ncbi:MAG: tRNA (adenosine(37)-N6)-threonylcarbamoyltransferase complex transferase subunit TsaD [Balneolaceae bacterium]|nr:tRNA (adenosine(37)-N6)-threonylcarbamoyltransferase complex transferase subunit TsaD [Balneolaceae bacterium]MBO6544821.1 tRNA (adenosine(37)-N6)-threonylcarbamoyltransferase complex transferase subunit TsaD [Balneolaceae bacterium]MBO6646217.1 tRNA (adenosine(37)-N6)-threonylcarbamoyltransferase complex transferase subunit TsaD [Balneolaceae bacterium]
MNILGIESSCDDTSASVLTAEGVQSNVIASQSIHVKFGGVVPELASRAHQTTITQTVEQALEEAEVSLEEIDVIAVTQGPGLMGSLLVGLCFAKGLALSRSIPIVGVNHMDAHIYANFIDSEPKFPFVCLTVSGGHTQLVYVKSPFDHEILGKTRDDAAGEAFDKIGKIFGLPYPAGAIMDKLARDGDTGFHKFPQALVNEGLDFSFSGLKTSALYFVQDKKEDWIKEHLNDLCASISEAITEVLIKKLKRAVKQTGVKTIALAGGVSANSVLREKAEKLAEEMNLSLHVPKLSYCTDNAAMIAITGKMKAELEQFDDLAMKPFASL